MEEQNRMTITTGMLLGNRYQIVRLIGESGMALVYLAVDQRTGRDVAVKVLKSELAQDEEFVRRFDTEAKAASSLSHPNIVKVLGVGEEAGMRYMIQEYVEGTTLKELIDHYGRLDWQGGIYCQRFYRRSRLPRIDCSVIEHFAGDKIGRAHV